MQSDFSAARELLESAQLKLTGADESSHKVREALDILIEAVALAEYRKPPAEVIPFPRRMRS